MNSITEIERHILLNKDISFCHRSKSLVSAGYIIKLNKKKYLKTTLLNFFTMSGEREILKELKIRIVNQQSVKKIFC